MKWLDYFYKQEQTQKKIENIMEFLVTHIFVEGCFNESVQNSDFEWAKT